ncbi:MAG TPA: response regulator transcription factor [Chloroflexia bacterium]|nr:response regulator transcription factor [Chloroflexia bacterium]
MPVKLLIAEDARDVAEIVAFGARMNWPGCQVIIAKDGEQALRLFQDEQPDIVILDISMPPPDGFEVCRRIREVSQVPILMLTARTATLDKIRALDQGADDYLTKPFDHLELLARLRALMRRVQIVPSEAIEGAPTENGHAQHPDLMIGDLTIDTATREVRLKGESVPLTSTEYRLLEELAKQAGTVVTHHYLLEHVWGPEYTNEEHYLKVFVRRLRRKLGDNAEQPQYIQTEWGVGYRFVAPR